MCGPGEQSSNFEKTKVLVKLMKALGISQPGLPLQLAVSMTQEGMGQVL